MNEWRTPPEIYNLLDAEFKFDLDAAASATNAKCVNYLTDALGPARWPGRRIWLNPPYGSLLQKFVRRAAEEAQYSKIIVALIPMRCRAGWWHDAVLNCAHQIRFVRRRIHFLLPDGSRPENGPAHDSVVVVWSGPFINGIHRTEVKGLIQRDK